MLPIVFGRSCVFSRRAIVRNGGGILGRSGICLNEGGIVQRLYNRVGSGGDAYDSVFGRPNESRRKELEMMAKVHPVVRLEYEVHPEARMMNEDELRAWYMENEMEVIGEGCPQPIFDFEHFPFIPNTKSILKSKFEKPSLIQSQGWPLALSGRDVVGSAGTGSGKTLAFILPGLEHVGRQKSQFRQGMAVPSVLVVAPTRELAIQINEETKTFLSGYRARSACLYGGSGNKNSQFDYLSRNPQVVIATPGRLLDFVRSEVLDLSNVSYVVLDEADRMLDMGFEEQMNDVMSLIRPDRQVLLWSATWPRRIEALASCILKDPVRVKIGSGEISVNKIVEQQFIFCNAEDRMDTLINIIRDNEKEKILIFTKTKDENAIVSRRLAGYGLKVDYLHGDRTQSARKSVLSDFCNGHCMILVATDVAARGLHIPDVNLIINYSIPRNIEDYVHRVGRTGRAGIPGKSISFFTREDVNLAKDMIDLLQKCEQNIPPELYKLVESSNPPQRKNPIQSHYQRQRPHTNSYDKSKLKNRYTHRNENYADYY